MSGSGYTVFVRSARVVLPLLALVLVALVFARLNTGAVHGIESAVISAGKTVPGQVEVEGARYEGVDRDGKAYTLIAGRAARSGAGARLTDVKADAELSGGGWISAAAPGADYAPGAQRLALFGGVKVYHDSGTEAEAPRIEIDLDRREASAPGPVRATGPLGTLEAAGLRTSAGGTKVIFAGPAKLVLERIKK